MNGRGTASTTTSSASAANASIVSRGATGTARTMRRAPRSRSALMATRAVAPVARPSSTTMTTRSRDVKGHAAAAIARDLLRERRLLAGREAGERALIDPRRLQHVRVEDARAALGDRAKGEFGLLGHAKLAHDEQLQGRVQTGRHLRPDQHAAARQADHDRMERRKVGQTCRQAPAGIAAIVEARAFPEAEARHAAPSLSGECTQRRPPPSAMMPA